MNDLSISLARLGESLAQEFQLRLSEWTTPEAVLCLPDADLLAMASAEGDAQRWQEEWMGWTQWNTLFSSDFIPENLLLPIPQSAAEPDTPDGAVLQPRGKTSPRQPEGTTLSRISSPSGSYPGAHLPYSVLEQEPDTQNPDVENQDFPKPGKTDLQDFPTSQIPASNQTDDPQPPALPLLPDATETTFPPSKKIPLPGAVFNAPSPLVPASTPPVSSEPATSIWSQPLQGLSDFVARYEPTENTGQSNATRGNPTSPASPAGAPPRQFAQPYPTPGYPKSGKVPAPSAPNLFVSPEMPAGSNFYVDPGTDQNTVENNENQSFVSVSGKKKTLEAISDTDDLLDELTQRIIRDFRRFYP